ncbi:MAG: uracil-DNA glycosylase family protein [Pseudomonadota bacterium]
MPDIQSLSLAELEALLRFHHDAGADEVLTDTPVNRFAQSAPQAKPTQKRETPSPAPVPSQPAKPAVIPDQNVVADATTIARQAKNLDELRASIEAFDGCNLKNTARNLAFEGGNRAADIMIVAGAPSRDDDTSGMALSGADGVLLTNMFNAIGVDLKQDTYQGLCVPWAPPGGGPPTPLHLRTMRPFIERQIELKTPSVLVVLGNVAAQHLLDPKQTILKLRGQWFDFRAGDLATKAFAMHEPAYLRQHASAKRTTWHDLLALKKQLTAR